MLPNFAHVTETIKLPLTGIDVEIRPFVMQEQKMLLIALEGEEEDEQKRLMTMAESLRKVVKACILSPKNIDIEDLPGVDLDWIFIQLRKISVNDKAKLIYKMDGCDCEEGVRFEVDYNDIQVNKPNVSNIVEIPGTDGTIKIKFKYPTTKLIIQYLSGKDKLVLSDMFGLFVKCVDTIYSDEEVYSTNNEAELLSWFEKMPTIYLKEMWDFFQNTPTLYYKTTLTCDKCNKTSEVEIQGIRNFFQ